MITLDGGGFRPSSTMCLVISFFHPLIQLTSVSEKYGHVKRALDEKEKTHKYLQESANKRATVEKEIKERQQRLNNLISEIKSKSEIYSKVKARRDTKKKVSRELLDLCLKTNKMGEKMDEIIKTKRLEGLEDIDHLKVKHVSRGIDTDTSLSIISPIQYTKT